MKRTIINLIVAVLVATTASAGITPSITTDGTKAFIVDTESWKSDHLDVEIRDNKGSLIFTDTYTTKNGKKFNFENLPNGEYTITLSDDLRSTTQTFEITRDAIFVNPNKVVEYKPVINMEDNHIDVNYLSRNSSTSVAIYGNNEKIYDVKFKDQNAVHQRFDISQLPEGSYTLSVRSGGRSYTERFKK